MCWRILKTNSVGKRALYEAAALILQPFYIEQNLKKLYIELESKCKYSKPNIEISTQHVSQLQKLFECARALKSRKILISFRSVCLCFIFPMLRLSLSLNLPLRFAGLYNRAETRAKKLFKN